MDKPEARPTIGGIGSCLRTNYWLWVVGKMGAVARMVALEIPAMPETLALVMELVQMPRVALALPVVRLALVRLPALVLLHLG